MQKKPGDEGMRPIGGGAWPFRTGKQSEAEQRRAGENIAKAEEGQWIGIIGRIAGDDPAS